MILIESPIPIPVFLIAAMPAPVVIARTILRRSVERAPSRQRIEALGTMLNVAIFGGAVVAYSWGLIVGLPIFPHSNTRLIDPIRVVGWTGVLLVQWVALAVWIWRSIPTERWIYAIGSAIVIFWCLASIPFRAPQT